jgi:hypothetical protein
VESAAVAKDKPKPPIPSSRKGVKLQASLDADLYVRTAAGAAMLGVSHSRFVTMALEAQLRDMGVFVGRRRSADRGDSSGQETESAPDAA